MIRCPIFVINLTTMKKLIFGLVFVILSGYFPEINTVSAKVIPNTEFQKPRPPKPHKPPKPRGPKKHKPPKPPRRPR
jgi:hypothetical protein